MRLCDRVFFVSRHSKPDGRESGQMFLGRFHIYENAVKQELFLCDSSELYGTKELDLS